MEVTPNIMVNSAPCSPPTPFAPFCTDISVAYSVASTFCIGIFKRLASEETLMIKF